MSQSVQAPACPRTRQPHPTAAQPRIHLLPRTSPLAVGHRLTMANITDHINMQGHQGHQQDEDRSETSSIDSNGFVLISRSVHNTPSYAARPEPNEVNMTETHTFPKALPDWSNLEVLHKNTLPPRATFFLYNSSEDALTRDTSKSKTLSLSGTWEFSLAKSPFDVPEDFFNPSYNTTEWGKIEVPGMWQLQGYGKGPQ